MPAAVTINVTHGTAVTVICQFTKPNRTTITLTTTPPVTYTPADPTTVWFKWWWLGEYATLTTWKYTAAGGFIVKKKTGLYVATITTTGGTASKIIGLCVGKGAVKATAQFIITVAQVRTI